MFEWILAGAVLLLRALAGRSRPDGKSGPGEAGRRRRKPAEPAPRRSRWR